MPHQESHPGTRNVASRLALVALGRVALVSCLVTGSVACMESKTCERQRLNLAKAWQDVNKAAEDAKVAGGDEMQWATIQKKLDVLQSAFATPQVTWDSADKNKDEAAALVGQITGSPSKSEIFRGTFNAAGAQQAAYGEACR